MNIPRISTYILLIISLTSLSACFPYHFTMKPGASGQVVDSSNKRPVEGATVTLTAYSALNSEEEHVTANTQNDGSFLIPAKQKWSFIILGPFDPLPLKARVSIRANGYLDSVRDININTMGPAISKLGIISLEQVTQH